MMMDTMTKEELALAYRRLKVKLLTIGGDRVVSCVGLEDHEQEVHAPELLARGEVFNLPVKFNQGEPNACHANASRMWARNPKKYQIVTGYSLDGGIWRSHSWVISKHALYESTKKRGLYFGVALEDEEALRFWMCNLPKDELLPLSPGLRRLVQTVLRRPQQQRLVAG